MSRIRSTRNRSTEIPVASALRAGKITGWRRHAARIVGRPDFYFPKERVALFIDGCFWHGCPRCGNVPKSNRPYWAEKLGRTRRRDRENTRALTTAGYKVLRVWEHDVRSTAWLQRLRKMLRGRARDPGAPSSRRSLVLRARSRR